MKRMLVPALFLSLLFLLLPLRPALAVETGAVAPDFELATLDGKKVRLSDYKGRIVILKLATTWCPTCKQQSQEIRDAGKFLQENDVAVVEVFLQDSEAMVREYFKDETYLMTHVALLDDGKALKAYNVYLIPRVVIIDREFKVRRDGSLIPARELIKEVEKIGGKG